MVGGSWMDTDGLYRQYGTTKAVPEIGGDFLSYGENRNQEYLIDLTTLTPFTTLVIPSNTTFIPAGVFIESVEIEVETAATGATATLSVGLIANDRTTVTSATAFVNAAAVATLTPAGTKLILTAGSTGAGGYIGTVTPSMGYLLVQAGTASFTAGKIRLRIKYHTNTTITQ